MKLTIITADNAVYKDDVSYSGLDLSSCGIPANVWALQWQDTSGWIEDKSALVDNTPITELPAWAIACVAKRDEAKAAEEAAILAAQQAIQQAAPAEEQPATEGTQTL
jgi:hypothetical protein